MIDHPPDKKSPVFELARNIDVILNGPNIPRDEKKWGFALLVYPFGETPHYDNVSYVGSGVRDDVRKAMKAVVERWELPT